MNHLGRPHHCPTGDIKHSLSLIRCLVKVVKLPTSVVDDADSGMSIMLGTLAGRHLHPYTVMYRLRDLGPTFSAPATARSASSSLRKRHLRDLDIDLRGAHIRTLGELVFAYLQPSSLTRSTTVARSPANTMKRPPTLDSLRHPTGAAMVQGSPVTRILCLSLAGRWAAPWHLNQHSRHIAHVPRCELVTIASSARPTASATDSRVGVAYWTPTFSPCCLMSIPPARSGRCVT